jgi:hypothetical protein
MERLTTPAKISPATSPSRSQARAGNFSDSSSNIEQFFCCLDPILSVRMYESGEELLHPEEIQQRFKKVFGRDMTRAERDIFFLPIEPSPEQEDND